MFLSYADRSVRVVVREYTLSIRFVGLTARNKQKKRTGRLSFDGWVGFAPRNVWVAV